MQNIWSRAARPPSVSCLDTAINGVTSRTTTASSRRRLRIGNSVTALYSSIFAAAALADAKAKDKRRLEWEDKITAVKDEVNELVEEEHRILTELTSRRTQLIGGRLQTRNFSTATPFHLASPKRYDFADPPSLAREAADDGKSLQELDLSFPEADDPLFDCTDEEAGSSESDNIYAWASGDAIRIKAIQKLALKQLAIRFLLRPVIAHNYIGLPMDYAPDFELPRLNTTDLLKELNTIRKRIRALKTSDQEPFDDLARDLPISQHQHLHAKSEEFDATLKNDINMYLSMTMSLPELLLRISNNLISCDLPDRPKSFQLMIMAFTRTRQNDLVDLVLRTVLPNRFTLTTPFIISTLTFFRKSKNLKDFDQFLQMLRGEGYPVNLRLMALYQKRFVNGVEITVPPLASCNPVIFGALIAAALRFDQPDRANAWLQVWRSTGYLDDFSTLCAFLRFYNVRNDWESGLHTMMRALTFIISTTSHPEARIERLIVHMVHFCDSCQRGDVSELLIKAAVQSGFNWKAAYKQSDIDSDLDPTFQRWQKAAEASNFPGRQRTTWERCHAYVTLVGEKIRQLARSEVDGFPELRHNMTKTYSHNALSMSLLGGQRGNIKELSNLTDRPLDGQSISQNSQSLNDASKDGLSQPSTGSATSNVLDTEILALKDEVLQLKRVVNKLRQSQTEESRKNTEMLRSEPKLADQNSHAIIKNVSQTATSESGVIRKEAERRHYSTSRTPRDGIQRHQGREGAINQVTIQFLDESEECRNSQQYQLRRIHPPGAKLRRKQVGFWRASSR
ncbi:hypothetical protein Egran_02598 [Elaphomyces granulatus]|uniref:Uncharacterized protein n=1 Tax=Elaphomyces granulatus TaxID=519963 RepID=A0A232LZQ3_9EURO|nr:hypothetical protein Egran_02598 [Elaphomyces granulatus]